MSLDQGAGVWPVFEGGSSSSSCLAEGKRAQGAMFYFGQFLLRPVLLRPGST